MRKEAAGEERVAKINKTTIRHFGFTEKVYGTRVDTSLHTCHINKLTVQLSGAKCIDIHTSIQLR